MDCEEVVSVLDSSALDAEKGVPVSEFPVMAVDVILPHIGVDIRFLTRH